MRDFDCITRGDFNHTWCFVLCAPVFVFAQPSHRAAAVSEAVVRQVAEAQDAYTVVVKHGCKGEGAHEAASG